VEATDGGSLGATDAAALGALWLLAGGVADGAVAEGVPPEHAASRSVLVRMIAPARARPVNGETCIG
jgi:hypothetical protein